MPRESALAKVMHMAIEVFGSEDAAQRWLSTPSIALNQRRPLDMLRNPAGEEAVMTLLVRIDYCVYT
jgi:putative toxin-antitoxin system antitoxin component (TIGR02293 family)